MVAGRGQRLTFGITTTITQVSSFDKGVLVSVGYIVQLGATMHTGGSS